MESDRLNEYLEAARVIPTEESDHNIEEVLEQLRQIIAHWVKTVALPMGLQGEGITALTVPYGSYPLRIHTQMSDLDVVCFVPLFIDKAQHFFVELHDTLQETGGVTGLQILDRAKVPLLKFQFNGLPIDLACVVLQRLHIPDDLDVHKESILYMVVDPRDVDSSNGPRDVNAIQTIVGHDDEHYRTAVRAIKHWAKQNGIYSGPVGYFSGIAITIMVARLRQQYHTDSCGVLVREFFKIYSAWGWPEPVFLYDIEKKGGAFDVWDWKRDLDQPCHKMPIISPAYPWNSVSHRVTPSTFRVLCEKLRLGHDICQGIEAENANWGDLFKHVSIFESYEMFVEIKFQMPNPRAHAPVAEGALADEIENQLQMAWQNAEQHLQSCKGMCLSRLKLLIDAIEKETKGEVYCIPDPSAYRSPRIRGPHCIIYVGLIKLDKDMQPVKDFDLKKRENQLRERLKPFTDRIKNDSEGGRMTYLRFVNRDQIAPDTTRW